MGLVSILDFISADQHIVCGQFSDQMLHKVHNNHCCVSSGVNLLVSDHSVTPLQFMIENVL